MKSIQVKSCSDCPKLIFCDIIEPLEYNAIQKILTDESIHPECPLPDHSVDANKTMPTRDEAVRYARELVLKHQIRSLSEGFDCAMMMFDLLAERMKP